jgi:uncharacterized RDD family membrane protein YckC
MAHATAVPVSGSKLDNRRVLAALIDLLIVGAGYAVILAAAGKLSDADAGGALTVVGIGWALYYYFACESGSGQTVGKRALNIRVVRTDGAPAGMREVGIRTVLRLVDGLFLYGVGLVVMLVTRERRGRLGDLAGGTMIVSADKPARVVDMSAPEAPADALRVPIAESGPAFAEVVEGSEPEPEVAEPVVEVEQEPEVAEPVLEVEPEPEVVAEPVAEMEPEPVAEVEPEPVAEVEPEPEAEPEPVVEVEPEPVEAETEEVDAVSEADDADVASQSLRELASDVTAVTEDPEREVEEEEPEVEEQIAAEAEDQPEAEEPEEEVTVKSVETVSAIDLVMEDEEAVAGSQGKGRRA